MAYLKLGLELFHPRPMLLSELRLTTVFSLTKHNFPLDCQFAWGLGKFFNSAEKSLNVSLKKIPNSTPSQKRKQQINEKL